MGKQFRIRSTIQLQASRDGGDADGRHYTLTAVATDAAESLEQYPWSSHRAYLTKTERSELLDTDLVLRMFSENKSRALVREPSSFY